MNSQKPEPRVKGGGFSIDFHSMFFTIQGEGPFAGHRAIFVRLAGCNLQCPGCDTEYTEGRQILTSREIVQRVHDLARHHAADGCLVVVTGGEPLRQPIGVMVAKLLEIGFRVQIESNGVFAPDRDLDFILGKDMGATLVVSPKTKRINERTAQLADAFKYVLDTRSIDPNDGLPIMALEHPASTGVARPPKTTFKGRDMFLVPVYLNPFDAKDEERNARNLRAVAESCMKHGYILGVQLHKLIGLE